MYQVQKLAEIKELRETFSLGETASSRLSKKDL